MDLDRRRGSAHSWPLCASQKSRGWSCLGRLDPRSCCGGAPQLCGDVHACFFTSRGRRVLDIAGEYTNATGSEDCTVRSLYGSPIPSVLGMHLLDQALLFAALSQALWRVAAIHESMVDCSDLHFGDFPGMYLCHVLDLWFT